MGPRQTTTPTELGWLAVGIGGGAFVDGIVLHQLLQWHHMVSSRETMRTVVGLELNTVADGLFHVAALIVTLVGVSLVSRRDGPEPTATSRVGLLLIGWGAFNVVEGVVNHQLLGVHHVRDDVPNSVPWDLGFLGVSAVLLALGAALRMRAAARG